MHAEADQWVARYGSTQVLQVLEIGSLNINGTARVHWPNARWLGIDRQRGPGVDVVCDFLDWEANAAFDVIV